MNATRGYKLLTEEEIPKISHRLKMFDLDGLYGQFPGIKSTFDARMETQQRLFVQAEETVRTILQAEEFAGFRSYCDGPGGRLLVAPSLDPLIKGEIRASRCAVVWAAHQRDNRNLMLIIHEEKLKLCTSEYVRQSDSGNGGVHWYRLFTDTETRECDCYRLYQALEILASPKAAWKYLRAKIYALEVSLNTRR